ncbi:MAG: NAD(P)H-dependent oxidoreductase subunit E [Bacillota bacterium]
MDERKKIRDIIERIGNTPDKLIEILLEIQGQSEEHYVTEEHLKLVSKMLDIPVSKAYGVATFYAMLSTVKKGRHIIQICNNAPCYVNGAKKIVSEFEEVLGIQMGEMTGDGMFSLEYTSCFGACHIAPAVKINDKVYGNLNSEKIKDLIENLRKEGM